MGPDRRGAEGRPALITDDDGDLGRSAPGDQVLRPDRAGDRDLLPALAIRGGTQILTPYRYRILTR
jgi:hypothetical protein